MRRTKSSKNTGQTHSYWQSYSDMMAALLLIFILIMAFTLVQSLKSYEEKIRTQEEQNALLMAQQSTLLEQKEQLKAQQAQIDELIGVKSEIIKALSDRFRNSNLRIDIDAKTGAISLDSSVLYAYDSSELSDEGKSFLREFLPMYISVLLNKTYRSFISEIIIEGHTDTNGDYMYNLNLSQKRAYSVAAYCLDESTGMFSASQLRKLRKIMTANGRSLSNPITDEDGKVDAEKSRRVEIKFRLKDEEMISALQAILEDGAT